MKDLINFKIHPKVPTLKNSMILTTYYYKKIMIRRNHKNKQPNIWKIYTKLLKIIKKRLISFLVIILVIQKY